MVKYNHEHAHVVDFCVICINDVAQLIQLSSGHRVYACMRMPMSQMWYLLVHVYRLGFSFNLKYDDNTTNQTPIQWNPIPHIWQNTAQMRIPFEIDIKIKTKFGPSTHTYTIQHTFIY